MKKLDAEFESSSHHYAATGGKWRGGWRWPPPCGERGEGRACQRMDVGDQPFSSAKLLSTALIILRMCLLRGLRAMGWCWIPAGGPRRAQRIGIYCTDCGEIAADHWPSCAPGKPSSDWDRRKDEQTLKGYWREGVKTGVLQNLITLWPCDVTLWPCDVKSKGKDEIHLLCVLFKNNMCFTSLKLDETDSADMHQKYQISPRTSASPSSSSSPRTRPFRYAVSTQAQTQSASNDCFIDEARVYSLTRACNNYRPNQLERGKEKHWESRGAGGRRSELQLLWPTQYSQLNNSEFGRVSSPCSLQPQRRKVIYSSVHQVDLLYNQYDETDARYSNILLNCFSLIFCRAYIKARQGNVSLSVGSLW